MSRIELRGIGKHFGTTPVLRDIDLTIERGEFCVFVGPSGCGKSTLLRILAGLDDADAGTIAFDGTVVDDLPPAKRHVAMVFQSYALYPHMSAYENMAFGLRERGVAHADVAARVREAAQMLQLDALLERRPRDLSGGERQRVAIGRAIVRRPRVFLFDEPLSNLDAALRLATRMRLADLHRALGDATMVYVTHDQVEAMTLADRIVLMQPLRQPLRDGAQASVAQGGPPLELYHHPANRFAAAFIGSPPMNFIDATVVTVQSGRVEARAGRLTLAANVDGAGCSQGMAITLGIRPEHVVVGQGDLRGRVLHVERFGDSTTLHLRVDGLADAQVLTARVARDDVASGDAMTFDLPPAAMHAFLASGAALPRLAAHAEPARVTSPAPSPGPPAGRRTP